MGEKGNVTSEELAAAASSGVGVLATGTTHVTAVLQDAGETIRDKIIDKGADAVIETTTERVRRRTEDPDGADDEAT